MGAGFILAVAELLVAAGIFVLVVLIFGDRSDGSRGAANWHAVFGTALASHSHGGLLRAAAGQWQAAAGRRQAAARLAGIVFLVPSMFGDRSDGSLGTAD